MWDEDRKTSDIANRDILTIIGQRENQWLEFKARGYRGRDDDGHEICKDITAMANASGGYIFIGVGTKRSRATGFSGLEHADKEISLIKSHGDKIEPRVPGLEVVERNVEHKGTGYDIVVIHVPRSANRPHAFYSKDSTIFVKREDDQVRRCPMLEIRDAFAARDIPGTEHHVSPHQPRRPVEADDNALEEDDPERLADLMQRRFEQEVEKEPYYRVFLMPESPHSDVVDTSKQSVREVLKNPAGLRAHGFGFRPIIEIKPSGEGIVGVDLSRELQVRLLCNGFFEVRYPLAGHHFQWRSEKFGYSGRWLYPYTVCEFPVSVLRVAKQLYTAADCRQGLVVRQEYWNAKGFVLAGGHPSGPNFGWEEWTEQLERVDLKGRRHRIPAEFDPDQTAYSLVRETYEAFGLDEEFIPLFDQDRRFMER